MMKTINFFSDKDQVLLVVNPATGNIVTAIPYIELYRGLDIDPPPNIVAGLAFRTDSLSDKGIEEIQDRLLKAATAVYDKDGE